MRNGFLRSSTTVGIEPGSAIKKGGREKSSSAVSAKGEVEWTSFQAEALVGVFRALLSENRTWLDLQKRLRYGTGASPPSAHCEEHPDDECNCIVRIPGLCDPVSTTGDGEEEDPNLMVCEEVEVTDAPISASSGGFGFARTSSTGGSASSSLGASSGTTATTNKSGTSSSTSSTSSRASSTKLKSKEGQQSAEEEAKKSDVAGRLLAKWTSNNGLLEILPTVLSDAAKTFGNIKKKGEAAGMRLEGEEAASIRKDVARETLLRELLRQVNSENTAALNTASRDAGLLATPMGWNNAGTNPKLDWLSVDVLRGLNTSGVGVQDSWCSLLASGTGKADKAHASWCEQVWKELELMEFDGEFEPVVQESHARGDRICYKTLSDLNREKQRALLRLLQGMVSLPFELNKKCNLLLQGSGTFQLSVFPAGSSFRRHRDGGIGDRDNGRKVTAIVMFCKPATENTPFFRTYPLISHDQDGGGNNDCSEDDIITTRPGRLLLLNTREKPYEILPTAEKRFLVSMYLPGPPAKGGANRAR